ncbi:uv radiation resistance protein [Diaporthe amygdali]|uniref:uv radiation resistance protein n=1 Tax=Phomopsis amygdali TaxID=1214568 RepID=UPI0022FE3ED1|nr:uv radiation resistance protein [Diaporthe amygdali]KAJ0122363.1 uv radiation resistance protein [Diaporthe amygdali]
MSESTRPLLLPQNRRIRHLRGIYLRNLSFDRPRGKTTDDSAVKHSADKAVSLRENAHLHHSASSESLRPSTARRRSTNLGSASPVTRQKRLEITIDSRVADSFFTLHAGDEEEPIYISETVERSVNFDFRFFELSRAVCSPTLRLPEVTIKFWAKRHGRWSLHLEESVDLRTLNFLGSTIGTHFPPNCLVFHLTDGVYTLELPQKTFPPRQGHPQPTSSYNALMRLSTLERSIQDALVTQETLKQQINELISETHDERLELDEAKDKLNLAEKYVSAEQKAVRNSSEQVEKMQTSIADRREKMAQGRSLMEKTGHDMDSALDKLSADKDRSSKVKDDIRGQRRRICEDLNTIFRIEPVPDGKPLQFQIRGISLPNAEGYGGVVLSGADEDALSAALGHVALLTHHLQFYLGVPLPYPITYCGSRSYITDDISIIQDSIRDFPLYLPRGGSAAQFRFDYGWFILNKDIETLCAAQGLKVMDIRHTLPNLKYLLYVCSAGTDELPERKKGGVRGLRAGIMRSRGVSLADDGDSIMSSRRGSVDSDLPTSGRLAGDELKKKMKGLRGPDARDDDGSNVPEISDVGMPFKEDFSKLTLRTKGMREHVGK